MLKLKMQPPEQNVPSIWPHLCLAQNSYTRLYRPANCTRTSEQQNLPGLVNSKLYIHQQTSSLHIHICHRGHQSHCLAHNSYTLLYSPANCTRTCEQPTLHDNNNSNNNINNNMFIVLNPKEFRRLLKYPRE